MSVANETQKQTALDTLTHYFKSAYEAAGLPWADDNEVEVQDALLDLVRSVVEEAREYAARP